jgi:hypothetical protein
MDTLIMLSFITYLSAIDAPVLYATKEYLSVDCERVYDICNLTSKLYNNNNFWD